MTKDVLVVTLFVTIKQRHLHAQLPKNGIIQPMHKRYFYLLATLSSLLLSGCGGAEADSKKAVLESLKDPDSAKFGTFTNIGDKAACLTVNARNSMGGYTGDQQASLIKHEGKWIAIDIDKLSHDMCVKIMTAATEKQ